METVYLIRNLNFKFTILSSLVVQRVWILVFFVEVITYEKDSSSYSQTFIKLLHATTKYTLEPQQQ